MKKLGQQVLRNLGYLGLCGLMATTISPSRALAQQPLYAALTATTDHKSGENTGEKDKKETININGVELGAKDVTDMLLLIKNLEGRVKDLETKSSSHPATTTEDERVRMLEDKVKELESKLSESKDANAPKLATVIPTSATIPNDSASPKASPADQDDKSAANNAPKTSFLEKTEFSGYVDGYYGYNFNNPKRSNGVLNFDNALRNFDTKHNQFSLNLVKLVLENKPNEASRLGFRTDLTFGPAADIIHASEPGGSEIFKHIQQAYISYLAPVGKGLQIDVGKYVTPHGYEVIETKDNWNYSRSFLFTLPLPYYHFGVRATYAFNDKVSLAVMMHNGYNNVVDNNTRRSFSLSSIIKPNSKLTIVNNYTVGPEQNDNKDDYRNLYDGSITYVIKPSVTFATNYFYLSDHIRTSFTVGSGSTSITATNSIGVHATGIVGYLHLQPKENWAFTPRFEYYRDNDGFTTGLRQELKSLTLTGERVIKGGLITRLEYRRDFSNRDYFLKSSTQPVNAQSTVTIGIIYAFSSKQ